MYDEIFFSPDPRNDQNGLIGVDDDSEYNRIHIIVKPIISYTLL